MQDKKYRIAIVGLGLVAEAHWHAYRHMDNIDLIGGLDPDANRCDTFKKRGVPIFTTLEELIAKGKPDIVCVCSAVSTHKHIVTTVADAGIDVLCEKPLAPDAESAQLMVRHCEMRGVRLFYGSTQRYLPAIAAAKELIANGEIGNVQMIKEELVGGQGLASFTPMSPIHYPVGGPGGGGWGLVDHGIHMLDLFPWLVGHEISSVYGTGNISGSSPRPEFAILEMGNAQTIGHLLYSEITFSSKLPNEGIFGIGDGWGNHGYTNRGVWNAPATSIDIYGADGSLRVFPYPNMLFLTTSAGTRKVLTDAVSPPVHFARQMDAFIDAIERGEDAPVSGRAGVAALQALEAIYASHALGKKVLIEV